MHGAYEISNFLLSASVQTVMDDWTWKVFGYRGRPRRGSFFNRFIKDSKRIKETFLIREFFIATYATGLLNISEKVLPDLMYRIADRSINELLNYEGVINSFSFTTRYEAKEYLNKGIKEYLGSNEEDSFSRIFLKRAQLYTEEHFSATWLVYIAQLVTSFDSPLNILDGIIREKYMGDIGDDLQ